MAKKVDEATKANNRVVATNRRARHNYAILETFEAGVALMGTDLIGQARTGMGKTFAFGVPLLHRVASDASLPLTGTPRALWAPGPSGPEGSEPFMPIPASACGISTTIEVPMPRDSAKKSVRRRIMSLLDERAGVGPSIPPRPTRPASPHALLLP